MEMDLPLMLALGAIALALVIYGFCWYRQRRTVKSLERMYRVL
jgi:hypothetical protein